MMRERAQEKAESARQLQAAQQANTAILQHMVDLRAMIMSSSQQPAARSTAPSNAEPAPVPASASLAATAHASAPGQSGQAKKKKRKKPSPPSPSPSSSYSDSSSESSEHEKRILRKKKKGKKKQRRRGSGTPVELRHTRTMLAGLYAAKSAASNDSYLRIVQQIGEVEYRIDRLLAQQRECSIF
eukprot:6195185-Pleurochrysis_carterae.AAC.1